jgi:hypothetical protein
MPSSIIRLFESSTCFEQLCAHPQEDKCINLLKPTGYVMHLRFNIQQLYALPTLYLCVFVTEMESVYCAVRTGPLNTAALRFVFKELIQPLV